MTIHARHYHNVAILSVNGRLDTPTAASLARAIEEQIASGYNRLVVDLKEVDYLSSAAIKVLVQGAQQTRRLGGDFRLASARGRVKHVLQLACIDTLIKLYVNVVAATASFFPGPIPGELPGKIQ